MYMYTVFAGLSHLDGIVHLVKTRYVFVTIKWKSAIHFIKLAVQMFISNSKLK